MTEEKNDCTLTFKCSHTGGKFEVTFRRRSLSHKFRIHEISGPVADASYKIFSSSASQPHTSSKSITGTSDRKTNDFESSNFNFSGWFCGCCRFAHPSDTRPVYSRYVRCGGCREYVCGASVREVSEGVTIFECVGECEGGGVINGRIESYTSSESVRPNIPQLPAQTGKEVRQLRAGKKE